MIPIRTPEANNRRRNCYAASGNLLNPERTSGGIRQPGQKRRPGLPVDEWILGLSHAGLLLEMVALTRMGAGLSQGRTTRRD